MVSWFAGIFYLPRLFVYHAESQSEEAKAQLAIMEKKLFKLLSKAYSSLKSSSGRATTFLDISLGELRPLRIMVLGDVAQPGAYAVSPTTTLFTSLYYFRGPTTNGSLRDIQLIRN